MFSSLMLVNFGKTNLVMNISLNSQKVVDGMNLLCGSNASRSLAVPMTDLPLRSYKGKIDKGELLSKGVPRCFLSLFWGLKCRIHLGGGLSHMKMGQL